LPVEDTESGSLEQYPSVYARHRLRVVGTLQRWRGGICTLPLEEVGAAENALDEIEQLVQRIREQVHEELAGLTGCCQVWEDRLQAWTEETANLRGEMAALKADCGVRWSSKLQSHDVAACNTVTADLLGLSVDLLDMDAPCAGPQNQPPEFNAKAVIHSLVESQQRRRLDLSSFASDLRRRLGGLSFARLQQNGPMVAIAAVFFAFCFFAVILRAPAHENLETAPFPGKLGEQRSGVGVHDMPQVLKGDSEALKTPELRSSLLLGRVANATALLGKLPGDDGE